MASLLNKFTVLRKGFAFAQQIPRALKRRRCDPSRYFESPPVLVNSFPKSGTHLLLQILRSLPETVYFGSFLASMPSVSFKERSLAKHLSLIRKAVPGEVLPAHLFFDTAYRDALDELNFTHFFVYRDPRDVAVSEAHYLTDMNRWHRMHRFYSHRLKTEEERISTAISGVAEAGFPCDYPSIRARFQRYQGWMEDDGVLAVKFEDLISPLKRSDSLHRIAEYYIQRKSVDTDIERIIDGMESSIAPERSHTFRKGQVGGWKRAFTERHKEEMKSVAGDLLIALNYESDSDW